MITALEVLLFLCPGVEVTIYGQEYEGIIWHNGTPAITKKEFENGAKLIEEYDYSEVFMFEEAHNDTDSAFRALDIYLKERGVDWSKIKEDAGIMVYAKTKFNEMNTPKYVGNKIIKLVKE